MRIRDDFADASRSSRSEASCLTRSSRASSFSTCKHKLLMEDLW